MKSLFWFAMSGILGIMGCGRPREIVELPEEPGFTLFELRPHRDKDGALGYVFSRVDSLPIKPPQGLMSQFKTMVLDFHVEGMPALAVMGGEQPGLYANSGEFGSASGLWMRQLEKLPEGALTILCADLEMDGSTALYVLSSSQMDADTAVEAVNYALWPLSETNRQSFMLPAFSGEVIELVVADVAHSGMPLLLASSAGGVRCFERVSSGELLEWKDHNSYVFESAIPQGRNFLIRDFDHDGWSDVFSFNAPGLPSDELFGNRRNGTFGISSDRKFRVPMGNHTVAESFDLNNDGLTDLLLADGGVIRVFQNGGVGMFTETTGTSGLTDIGVVSGMLAADFDNDGWKDLAVVCKYDSMATGIVSGTSCLRFFRNSGGGQFEDATNEWFKGARLPGGHISVTDYDRDGDLDLVIHGTEGLFFLRNNIAPNENWLRVSIEGPNGNPFAEGAKAVLFVGRELRYHEFSATNGMRGGSELVAHFGLSATDKVDSLLVVFPDRTVVKRKQPELNRTVFISHAEAQKQPYRIFDYPRPAFSLSNLKSLGIENGSFVGVPVAIGDFNGDGRPGIFVGGGKGRPGMLFQPSEDGTLEQIMIKLFEPDARQTDSAVLFFDADMDGDDDLYVGTADGPDRLYVNDGNGNFTKSKNRLPTEAFHTLDVRAFRFDQNKSPDLVLLTQNEGLRILRQQAGRYVDETHRFCPVCPSFGTIRFVELLESREIIVVTEDGSLKVLSVQADGVWVEEEGVLPGDMKGDWCGLAIADLDGDGVREILLGNQGLNVKPRREGLIRESGILRLQSGRWMFEPLPNPGQAGPIRCFVVRDFDGDGRVDIIAAGNHSEANIGNGFFFRGTETGWEYLPAFKSGFHIPGNAQAMVFLPGVFADDRLFVFYDDEEPTVLNCRP